MKVLLKKVFTKLGNLFFRLAASFNKTEVIDIQSEIFRSWFAINGDKTHRLNYELGPNSLVFDLGGYEGQWTSDIFSIYCCNIYIFEPYLPFAQNIENRFKKNDKIKLFKIGLGARNEKVILSILDNGSSIFKDSDKNVPVELVSFLEFLKIEKIESIDLIKINIEGGEYDLLETILMSNVIYKIKNIQVQFHDFVKNAEDRMGKIQEKLVNTHHLTYQYKFVWENWERNT